MNNEILQIRRKIANTRKDLTIHARNPAVGVFLEDNPVNDQAHNLTHAPSTGLLAAQKDSSASPFAQLRFQPFLQRGERVFPINVLLNEPIGSSIRVQIWRMAQREIDRFHRQVHPTAVPAQGVRCTRTKPDVGDQIDIWDDREASVQPAAQHPGIIPGIQPAGIGHLHSFFPIAPVGRFWEQIAEQIPCAHLRPSPHIYIEFFPG